MERKKPYCIPNKICGENNSLLGAIFHKNFQSLGVLPTLLSDLPFHTSLEAQMAHMHNAEKTS